MRNQTSMRAASANRASVSPDMLKSVRTRMEPRKLARASSVIDMFASVRLAPSKLASAASLILNELPVTSAFEKSEPCSSLISNFPPGTRTPAKSLLFTYTSHGQTLECLEYERVGNGRAYVAICTALPGSRPIFVASSTNS